MTVVTIEEAQARLPELIEQAASGEDIVIAGQDLPAVKLMAVSPTRPKPTFGALKGRITIIGEDDDHLADFQDYMF